MNIYYIKGVTWDRLPKAISATNFIQGQFLVLPAIADCQCLTISCCVYDVASENEFPSDVEAMVSVTMASNTGLWMASKTWFDKNLNQAFLFACWKHMHELSIKHNMLVQLFEHQEMPYKIHYWIKLKKRFDFINLDVKTLWEWFVNRNTGGFWQQIASRERLPRTYRTP